MYMFHRGSEGKCLYFVLTFISIKCHYCLGVDYLLIVGVCIMKRSTNILRKLPCLLVISRMWRKRFQRATCVSQNGHQGNIFVCSSDEEIPVFGKIVYIIVTNFCDCLFILILHVYWFHTHYNAFVVHTDTTHYLVY